MLYLPRDNLIFKETKADRAYAEELDPKLLFPTKEWLLSFLPGHDFEWDIEEEEPHDISPAPSVSTPLPLVNPATCKALVHTRNS